MAEKLPFDPLALCPLNEEHTSAHAVGNPGEPFEWHTFDGDLVFPAVIQAIVAGAKSTGPPATAAMYDPILDWVRANPEAVEDAIRDFDYADKTVEETVVRDGVVVATREALVKVPILPSESLSDERRTARAEVLEIARKWFTNELHLAIGGKRLGVKIVKRPRWKL